MIFSLLLTKLVTVMYLLVSCRNDIRYLMYLDSSLRLTLFLISKELSFEELCS